MEKALGTTDVKRSMESQKSIVLYLPPAELGARLRAYREKYADVIDQANIVLTP